MIGLSGQSPLILSHGFLQASEGGSRGLSLPGQWGEQKRCVGCCAPHPRRFETAQEVLVCPSFFMHSTADDQIPPKLLDKARFHPLQDLAFDDASDCTIGHIKAHVPKFFVIVVPRVLSTFL